METAYIASRRERDSRIITNKPGRTIFYVMSRSRWAKYKSYAGDAVEDVTELAKKLHDADVIAVSSRYVIHAELPEADEP